MGNFVINGALIKCSQAFPPGQTSLVVMPTHMADSGNQPIATTQDIMPANIPTFGMCNTEANPAVAAATSAASGVHTPAPCMPNVVGPWMPGSAKTTVGPYKALTKDSTCKCAYTGEISIVQEGQVTASVG
ncbi:MAG TPA: DUF4280 domain-containing protein [Candidatus Limnocylindrales bacterium]|nr:DUF4280 domain-containing protein [Candidatus Limnocylindrales bacterium]